MSRDIQELASGGLGSWIALAVVAALPLLAVALMIRSRRKVFLAPLGCALLVLLGWFLFYAGHWYEEPGAQGRDPQPLVLAFSLPLLALGWFMFAAALVWPRSLAKRYMQLLDPRPLR
jgi:hypothetical protein